MATSAFRDHAVVLTGASSGIGRELALQLAGQGARLALAARRREPLEQVAGECRLRGAPQAVAIPADVGEEEQSRRLVEAALADLSRLDTLILNAGLTMWTLFEELETLKPLQEIMRVNYFGAVYPTYYALPHLKASRGRIVGVASLTGKTGVPTRTGYAASKHAMAGFFDSLRIELAASGVTVTMAYPDFVATGVQGRAFGPDGRPLGESPIEAARVMPTEVCARLILEAAARRRREVVMGLRGKLGLFLRPFAPGLIDRIARRAIARGR
jgi:short-subunit dehydrogenase